MAEKWRLRATDPTLDFLERMALAINRENYLTIAHLGSPPKELDAESESQIRTILDEAADAQFIFQVTCKNRQLLEDMLIRIEERDDVE
jgi:hypothetical protein